MNQTSKYGRLRTIITILFKYGVDEAMNRTNLASHLPKFLQPSTERIENIQNTNWTTRIRLALEELGPAFVKLGQIMSTRPDLIPNELIEELKRLQDQVEVDDIDIVTLLKTELDEVTYNRISSLSSSPLASASISQVYTGLIDENLPVVFKVQRPVAKQNVLADIQLMRDLVVLIEKIDSSIKNMNMLQLIDTFEQNMIDELNFTLEKQHTIRFKEQNGGNENLSIPEIYEDFCSADVLCIEQMFGTRINEYPTRDLQPITTDTLVHNFVDTFLDQILKYGFFHADPHPGNVLVDERGRLIFIDYGSMGTLSKHEVTSVQNILIYFLLKNTDQLIEVVKDLALYSFVPDETALRNQVDELVNIFSNNDMDKLDFTTLVDKFTEISKVNKIVFPHSIYLLVRGLALIEGTVRNMIPNMNLSDIFRPHLTKLVKSKLNKKTLINTLLPLGFEALDMVKNAPARFNKLSNDLSNGKFVLTYKESAETEKNKLSRVHLSSQYILLGVTIILLGLQIRLTEIWDLKNYILTLIGTGILILLLSKINTNSK